ncbi:hypothetical protein BD413DRAFT_612272 [Trametes elegans]|nr:hypothetical protein BD413DRAFT_612272 [Trametes elegans]
MPSSTASLGSLSSPSPSPPPPEEQHSNHSGAAGLDSGSELSELTEDEQDNDNRANEDESSRAASRRRRQADHIVPAPMWDWAYKQKKSEKKEKSDWRNKSPEEEEEEEEEEQAGPAKAMEEEEEDDLDKESNPDDDDVSPSKSRALSDNEAEDIDDEDPPEEDVDSADELPPNHNSKTTSGDVSAEEEDDLDDADPDAPDGDFDRTPAVAASPDLTDDENDNVGDDEVDEDDQPDPAEAAKDGSDVEDEEEDAEAPAEDADALNADEPPPTEAVTPAEGIVDPVEGEVDAPMEVDAPQPILMSPVAVAASSIMAGASLIQPSSPTSSQPSTPSISRVSSRYPSAEPEQEPDVPSEPEAEPEPEPKPSSGRAPRSRKSKARTRNARRSRAAAAAEAGEIDVDADHLDGIEGENADGDDMDVATPEVDLDADMQPAHRAEALDVLASIELKFALLRERLYVEKMDTLAWEEGLIANGTHPELLHLHAELTKRRDKRLELASHRRDYEIANVTKRRRLDEEGVWSWWKDARDELQTDMISETNSKRRRLERERRALERPQPSRPLPLPPVEIHPAPTLREIVKSSPFGIPEAALPLSKRSKRKRAPPPSNSLIYPQIPPLSHGEIAQDLDLFMHHRRAAAGFDPHRGPGLMNSVLGGMPPPGMDPYVMGMPMLDGHPSSRFGPPYPQHLPQQGLIQGFAGPPPRLPHHHSAPPGGITHLSHSQMQIDQEIAMGMRPPSGIPQPPPHYQQQFGTGPGPSTLMRRSISPVPLSNGAGPSSGVPHSMGGGPLPPGYPGPKPNGWTGPPTGVHTGNTKELGRVNGEVEGRDRDRIGEALNQRERAERERAQGEMEREREAERAYHLAQGQARHTPHQHAHQHTHGSAQPQSTHGPHTHLHHHHHVRHHHHTTNQMPPGPGGPQHAPPMAGLQSGSSNGLPNPTRSPHATREFEPRRPRSGAPTEVIELSASSSQKPPAGASPRMAAYWKGGDESMPPEALRDRERDRGRAPVSLGPSPPGPHERLVTPFTMGPSQPLQSSRPGSPRGGLPPSMPSSRRGSWSALPDDARPPSAPHGHPGAGAGPGMPPGGANSNNNSQRASGPRVPQPPPPTSYHSPFGSPPYSNGARGPSPPPSFGGAMRSPARGGQPGLSRVPPTGMPLSPPPPQAQAQAHSMSHSPHVGSPGGARGGAGRARPPSPPSSRLGKGLAKMEGFPMPESGNIAPIGAGPQAQTLLGPMSAGVSRLANSGGLGEKPPSHLPGGPPPPPPQKVVPVDGS